MYGRAETLSSAPLFVCRAHCPAQFQRGINCTEFKLILYLHTLENSPHWQTMSIRSGTQTISDLTVSSLLACGFHKLMVHFGIDTEGFSVWTWSSDMREMDFFSLISYLWSNTVFKNDNLGLASLTNPLPDLYPPFPPMKQWLWSQCKTETLLVLGVYYLFVKNVGLMCGQCRSLSGPCQDLKTSFLWFLFYLFFSFACCYFNCF